MKRRWFVVTTLLLLSCAWSSLPTSTPAKAGDARLLLVICVDQMRPDYFTRFGDQFTGGLKYLAEKGRIFSDAHQDHACTLTGSGHSTILSGLHPARSGIVGNDWYDRRKKKVVQCIEDPEPGRDASPRAFSGTTLGDWLLKLHPSSKVFAISRKDRSAILMAGQNPSGVFWFETSLGLFITSSYYKGGLPAWVKEFNLAKNGDRYLGQPWDRLLADSSAYERSTPDDQEGEGQPGSRTFPHVFTSSSRPDARFYTLLAGTPFMDELTLRLAEAAVRSEKLGQREALDLLAISLSSTDSVGHRFGPDSQEIQDMVLRLDKYLGDFFQFLDPTVGMGNVLIALTSDHGVQPLPEVQKSRRIRARRVTSELQQLIMDVVVVLETRFGRGPWIQRIMNENFYLDHDRIQRHGVSQTQMEEVAARTLRSSSLIEDAFTRTELLAGRPHKSPFAGAFLNSFNPQNSGDILFQYKINHLPISTKYGTTHGSPYPYDTHVPLIFAGPGVAPGTVSTRARTVDIAPTLAEILEIPVPAGLDGRPLFAREAKTQ